MGPTYQCDGLWFFWDETWSYSYGPYPSEMIAREMLYKYGAYLDGPLSPTTKVEE